MKRLENPFVSTSKWRMDVYGSKGNNAKMLNYKYNNIVGRNYGKVSFF